MNDELLIDTGNFLENFLFGGTRTSCIDGYTYVSQWPSQRAFDFYSSKVVGGLHEGHRRSGIPPVRGYLLGKFVVTVNFLRTH